MEFDSESQGSDEGVELSISDNGDLYPSDYLYTEENQPSFLEAKIVYLLMPKNIPISRATRLQWLLDHLNTIITLPSLQYINTFTTNLEIFAIVPRELNGKCSRFLVTQHTEVRFLSHSYRFVYCLDMSPSQANIDIEKGEILFDEIFTSFRNSLEAISKSFMVPGNPLEFRPSIFLTVMANTPFIMTPAQQVLIKGVEVKPENLSYILSYVETQFHLLEEKIADVTARAHQELFDKKSDMNVFYNEEMMSHVPNIPMVTPDVNFVNMLRYSMLAITLLPEYSVSHILVITDGIVAMPDSNIMESLLYQLQYDSISVSFLKVGSSFHPHSSAGYVSYVDLLHFLARSTLGVCLENFSDIKTEPSNGFNTYQELFLIWSFYTVNKSPSARAYEYNKWSLPSEMLTSLKSPPLLYKKHIDENTTASPILLLHKRLREGFTVDNIVLCNGTLEVKLTLEWKSFIYIHYKASCQWPAPKNLTRFEIFIAAPYEFLYNVNNLRRDNRSTHRQNAVMERFWMKLVQLAPASLGLSQLLSTFQYTKDWYTLPESVKNGIPVFILNTSNCNESRLSLTPRDLNPKFITCWQQICQLETNTWRKWFHTLKVSLILRHDQPLPKYLHLPNSSQRFQIVQCRQSAAALCRMLAEWASFVLVDNHTYVKLLYREPDKPPVWFCLVRISSKFPCAVLNFAFTTNTPGYIRYEVSDEVKTELSNLFYSNPVKKEHLCCVLLQKPLEKILIRYERIPTNFSTVILPDGTQPPLSSNNMRPSTPSSNSTNALFTTLSRYLFHKRWIWSATYPHNPRLSQQAVSRILNTLTKMRLEEGFSFAHSSSGIITMVLELCMEPNASCIVQYVLFPPYCAGWGGDGFCSGSEEENDFMSENSEVDMRMVTEVWIEPQYGTVVPTNSRISYMDNKQYYEIADVISRLDLRCINSLLTTEHLSLMCQEKSNEQSILNPSQHRVYPTKTNFCDSQINHEEGGEWYPIVTPRIEHIPFQFDPINILQFCQQTELLFSMFIENREKGHYNSDNTHSNKLLLEKIMAHFTFIHDQELSLSKEDSDRFTNQILLRHKNTQKCPISEIHSRDSSESYEELPESQWRCFIKGVSVTHVILTFIPSSLEDLKFLVSSSYTNLANLNESSDSNERTSSRSSNISDVPINPINAMCLPVYVYDCPLGNLVKSYIEQPEDYKSKMNCDIYEDHRFKVTDEYFQEYDRLKSDSDNSKNSCADTDKTVREHCNMLVLAHSKCFTNSLFSALHSGNFVHNLDVISAMDQCDDSIIEIDITDYILTICGHSKNHRGEFLEVQQLRQATPCSDIKSLHNLIKDTFLNIIGISFSPIKTNTEFYFYRNLETNQIIIEPEDSDDEISNNISVGDYKSEKNSVTTRSSLSDLTDVQLARFSNGFTGNELNPLFLHLVCTVRYNNGEIANIPVRKLPTCLGELIQQIDTTSLEKSKLQVTLDIFCLTLPINVQNFIRKYSNQGLRTTSLSSDTVQSSIGSSYSETSFSSDPDPLAHLPEYQRNSILVLTEEIKWLLKDEIATALLDVHPVEIDTLNFVMRHVGEGEGKKGSCKVENIYLNFVYSTNQSYEKFLEEFSKIKIPNFNFYKVGEFYYLAKDPVVTVRERHESLSMQNGVDTCDHLITTSDFDKGSKTSLQSDISSDSASIDGSNGGYDEDVSDDSEDFDWLNNLNNKRLHLPNFWLITKVCQDVVTIYFHCRFLNLPSAHSGIYKEILKSVRFAIKDLCKKVNQLLLLQSLYETRTCDRLLEPDDIPKDLNQISRNSSFIRLRSMEEATDDSDIQSYATSESSLNCKAGEFSCPVVWETHFTLHPRLKTGPGKSGISRGIKALKNVLDKFSVSNRNNMFVHRDLKSNVFYLRLHENVQYSKNSSLKPNEFETSSVSRSPSVASLPLGQRSALTQSEQSISSMTSSDIRPRVRSFGEKETKEGNEDTLILKVHGITDVGDDVKCDLVQVLQNRLDDAVLECLSIMLDRNAMCPLTPEDVRFIQKPVRPPECSVGISIQDFALQCLDSFGHYLKQNMLQFLNIPKYTDNRSLYHFKDYPQNDDSGSEDSIFIYNQGQNQSSGSKGIACIALSIINNAKIIPKVDLEIEFKACKDYNQLVQASILKMDDTLPDSYIEFRIWKQGRVNIENLNKKLKDAVRQATWDILTEYYLLKSPLCLENDQNLTFGKTVIDVNSENIDTSKEVIFNCFLDTNKEKNINEAIVSREQKKSVVIKKRRWRVSPKPKTSRSITFENFEAESESIKTQKNSKVLKIDSFQSGDEGRLDDVYAKYLPEWMDFGVNLNVPAVKAHKIGLISGHMPNVAVKELLNMLQDSPKAFRAISTHCLVDLNKEVFVPDKGSSIANKYIIISRNLEHWLTSVSMTQSNMKTNFDLINSNNLKHVQKYVPNISNNNFIPRQKILWILVENDNIIFYTYNWTKDNIEKLINNCTNLGQWLCIRSCFLNSVISQKLGLFNDQPLTRKCFMLNTNPYLNYIGDLEYMRDFHRELIRKRSQSNHNIHSTLQAFRDSFRSSKYIFSDPLEMFIMEMQEMKSIEKKQREEMKKLHAMYQSRTSTTSVPQIYLLMQNSRILHYCHTPLLFLPRWRLKAASTRDHSLYPSQAIQIADKMASEEKEAWHTELCYEFFCNYRQYLQTLAFMPLQIDNHKKTNDHAVIWSKDKSSYKNVFYIQKTILGGILLFTVEFSEPFFITKLHAIECNRLQNISSRTSINTFTLSFLDECDRVKILMHLHSFTYDYHLRCIYNYISHTPAVKNLAPRYNVHHFLDDFMKYYNKAPNFARNLVHADTLTIENLLTEGKQLYDYLLSNVNQYNFKVLEVDLVEGETEYILVQVTCTPQVSYKDAQDRQHTDDFDITLVVYNLCTPYSPTDNVLHLKYYLILTSKREIYPKLEVENKLGKFRTVSWTSRSLSALERSCPEMENSNVVEDAETDINISDDQSNFTSSDNDSSNATRLESSVSQHSIVPHVEILQESVNYLGYYSSHEQLMQQLILDKAHTTQKHIKEMVDKGMVHCRTHLLWNRLISPQETNALSYEEFMELKGLARLQHVCDSHSNLGPLLNQSLSWYQGLSKLLMTKFANQNRTFVSPDGNVQHYVILHQKYFGAFMLLSMDLHISRGELYAVYREPSLKEDEALSSAYKKSLLDSFVNCICFYLWSGMISN